MKRSLLIPPPDRHSPPRAGERNSPRINEQIRISAVRVFDAKGEDLGVIPTNQAMDIAREQNLDLVEVAANQRPPVCKIMDYAKVRYSQSRKASKTKTHHQKVKEIRVRPKTGEHDIETKVNQAKKFLEHHDKVLIKVLFRGRELQHIEEGQKVIQDILQRLADFSKIEKDAMMEGKQMTAMLAPKSNKSS